MSTTSFVDHVSALVVQRNIALGHLAADDVRGSPPRDDSEQYRTLAFLSRLMLNRQAISNIQQLGIDRVDELRDAAHHARLEREGMSIVCVVDFSECHNAIHRNELTSEPEGHAIHALLHDPLRPRTLLTPATIDEIEHYLYAVSDRLRCPPAGIDEAGNPLGTARERMKALMSRQGYERLESALQQFRTSMHSSFSSYNDEEVAVFDDDSDEEFLHLRNQVYNHLRVARRARNTYTDAVDAWNVAMICRLNERSTRRRYRLMTRHKVRELFSLHRLEGSSSLNSELGIRPEYACSSAAAFYLAEAHRVDTECGYASEPALLCGLAETMEYLRRTSDALLKMWVSNATGRPPSEQDVAALCTFEVDEHTRNLARAFADSACRQHRPARAPRDEDAIPDEDRATIRLEIRAWARDMANELWNRLGSGRITGRDRRAWNARRWLRAIGEPQSLAPTAV